MAAFLHPFTIQMWLAVLVCIFTMPVTFRVVLQKRHSATKLFMFALSSLLTQGMDFCPKIIREYLLSFWFLAIGFLSHIYSALLLSFLTFPSLTGIKTIQDLADGISLERYDAETFPGNYLSTFMRESSEKHLKTIGDNLQNNEDDTDFVSRLEDKTNEKKIAYIHAEIYFKPYSYFYFISEDRFTFTYCAFPMSKDFCCGSKLIDVIHRFWSSGIFQKIDSDENFKKLMGDISRITVKNESGMKLTLTDLKGLCIFLTASHLLAFFVLLIEICIGKFKGRQKIE